MTTTAIDHSSLLPKKHNVPSSCPESRLISRLSIDFGLYATRNQYVKCLSLKPQTDADERQYAEKIYRVTARRRCTSRVNVAAHISPCTICVNRRPSAVNCFF